MSADSGTDSVRARDNIVRGSEARHEGRDDLAHTLFSEAHFLAKRGGERSVEARALRLLADLAFHYNPTPESAFGRRMRLANEALSIYREIGDKAGASRSLQVLATVSSAENADRMLEESLSLAEEVGDKELVADALERQAAHCGMRDKDRSKNLLERAVAIYREIGDRPGEAQALFSQSIRLMSDDPPRSRALAEAALVIYRELGRKKQVAQMLMFLDFGGNEDVSNEREARLNECRNICREIGVACWEAGALRSLADIMEARGDSAEAARMRREAHSISPEPELDSELIKAFESAVDSDDIYGATDALRGAFIGQTPEDEKP